jgi:hypothetical protein
VSASSTLEARIRGALTPLENLLISGTTTKCLSDEEFYAQEFTERPVEIIWLLRSGNFQSCLCSNAWRQTSRDPRGRNS